ncbi:IclR family transcriptional regulator [Ruicaihuangia caeni]|uniref:IclR family transcriptional regulator n=1 Tax=Ruicaihuangia caeni TaxID=3042517 RepID=A0AAW6T8D9_9MICO|nr:IclR family transcriptional regulator [Klugiella sp. YN-L-19]MDI2098608.1 IclR family transcriptional regulator [Klugiella sp. YN-L-19]
MQSTSTQGNTTQGNTTQGAGAAAQNKTKGVDSARRVLQILLQFGESKPEVTIEEVAAQHNISIPSAYRYIALLRELYLVEERNRGTYVLSPQVLRLTAAAEASIDVAAAAQPVVDRLVAQTGETALAMRRIGDSAVCVVSSQPDLTLGISFRPGHLMPLHRGAGPKVLLASMPRSRRESYLSRVMHESSPARIDGFRDELRAIAKAGLAISDSEVDDGIWAVAAAVNVENTVVATISIAGPSFRIGEARREELVATVQAAAREVEAAIRREEA